MGADSSVEEGMATCRSVWPSMDTRKAAACLVFFLLLSGAFVAWNNAWFLLAAVRGGWQAAPFDPLACPPDAALFCSSPPASTLPRSRPPARDRCPLYFRWIHEDLGPWAVTGITREMVERAEAHGSFRLVVIDGRAYVERYGRRTFQTRDLFTQWSILQLLRLYPGRVPDLELLFDCGDRPTVKKAAHPGDRGNTTAPPVFGYCTDDASLRVVFPDWSFWGWPEVNIKPWRPLMEELKEGNRRLKWSDREPYAYWKGNPWVSAGRVDLLRCNLSGGQDWNARLYIQEWGVERMRGFKTSDLAGQCKHRYKIYIEGAAWSVSEKYILACDSPTLRVRPRSSAFFSRGLVPLRHYWPLNDRGGSGDECRSVEFAVDWGNAHQREVQEIGRQGSGFTQQELKMEYVYDYMLHLLSEYAKLLRFKPAVPPAAVELCAEVMACPAKGLEREFMMLSMVEAPRGAPPCALPPPFSPAELSLLMSERTDLMEKVAAWERQAAGTGTQKMKIN